MVQESPKQQSPAEANDSALRHKAVPLVYVDESDQLSLRVSDVAVKLLSRRPQNKIAVVSIFGEI